MIKEIIKKKKGFVMLFSVTISAILLAIALGVANIALKEVKFGTSAVETNNAFFAADSAIESVLFNDKPPGSDYVLDLLTETTHSWDIPVMGLGSEGENCATVNIVKDSIPPSIKTTVTSKGYNAGVSPNCTPSNPDRIERQLEVRY